MITFIKNAVSVVAWVVLWVTFAVLILVFTDTIRKIDYIYNVIKNSDVEHMPYKQ